MQFFHRCCLAWLLFYSVLQARCDQVAFSLKSSEVLNDRFSNYVRHLMDLWNVKGVSMAVVKPDGEVEYGAWGIRTEDGEPMTSETLFGIASCSKAFLASSMGILFDDYAHEKNTTLLPEGLQTLNWDTKIKDVLPDEWELMDEWATEKANIKDILSHLSGLPRHDASYSPSDTTAGIVHRLRFLRPAHELRQKLSYNNQMFVVGAHVISKYTGSYTNFATERIFKPLEMNSTTFSRDEAARSGELTQTWTAYGQRIPYWNTGEKELNAGPGGVISSATDLSEWIGMLLSIASKVTSSTSEELTSSKSVGVVLPKFVYEAVTSANAIYANKPSKGLISDSIAAYGMGWARYSYQGHEAIMHSGAIPGLSSQISLYPNDGFGVVTLLNTGDRSAVTHALTYRVAEDMLGLTHKFSAEEPRTPPSPRGQPGTITPLPLSAYSGAYTNPGYGTFVLCDPEATSHYCDSVLSSFRAVDSAQSLPFPPQAGVTQLFAAWPRTWSSHIRLVHAENNTNKFDISFTALFPEGYGRTKTPFETYENDLYDGQVEFVIDEEIKSVIGFGYFGTDDMQGVRKKGLSIKGGAIAWFEKV